MDIDYPAITRGSVGLGGFGDVKPVKLLLYTVNPPHGRCLLLAQQLRQVTSLADGECVQVAMRLFDGRHPREDPAIIEVSDGSSTADLETICAEVGITIEGARVGKELAQRG